MSNDIEEYVSAATSHAESSGDARHEVGDLQVLLRQAWDLLGPAARMVFLADDGVHEAHSSALFEDPESVPFAKDAEALIASARMHGEDSEPDFEAGDLQIHVRAAYEALSPEAKAAFGSMPGVAAVLERGGPAPGP